MEQPFGIVSSGAWKQHLQYDIENCKVHTDLNVADPLTKFLSQEKPDHSLGVNHIAMCTRLLTLVNPLGISYIDM